MTAFRYIHLEPHVKVKFLIILLPIYLVGLIYGKFILSLAMIFVILLSLMGSYRTEKTSLESSIEYFLRSPVWWIITGYFFIVLFGGWYSEDTTSWLVRLRIKLPFLILPFCFFLLPRLSEGNYNKYICILVMVIFLSTIPVLFSILIDFQSFLTGLSEGTAANTPVSHIRYSLMVAMACFGAFILYYKQFYLISKGEVTLYLFLGIYFFLFIHLIAVRSGILCFYLTGLLWVLRFLWKKQTRIRGFALALILVSFPFIMISTMPSVQERWDYMVNDFNQFRTGKWNAYSDSERILSVMVGLEIIRDHPWWGVGPGDLKETCQERFLTKFDKTTFLLPHNQFISVAAGSGLIGLGVFIISFFLPVIRFIRSPEPFWFSSIAIIFFSFLVENTLETAVGTGLFILPLLMGIRFQEESN